ncbi:MAG: hypothetical protein ACHQNE_01295 [Candidatus Kapaibacterium sp.]
MFKSPSIISLLLLAVGLTFNPLNLKAKCLNTGYLEIYDFTPFGYSSTKQIPLFNPQSVPVKILNAHLDSGYEPHWSAFLSIDSNQFPIIVQPGDSSFVSLSFSIPADSAMQFVGYSNFGGSAFLDYQAISLDTDSSSCPYLQSEIDFAGFRLSPDTLLIPIFDSNTPIILYLDPDVVIWPAGLFVRFLNNSSVPQTILSRTLLEDSIAFLTPYWGYSSDTMLKTNGSFIACIDVNPLLEQGLHMDTVEYIVLHFADGMNSRNIPIEFIELGVSEQLSSSVQCSIVPNPTAEYALVSLSGFVRASIRICDAIGREVKPPIEVLGPDCTSQLDLNNLAQGSYFILIQGEDSNGKSFTRTQSMILSH